MSSTKYTYSIANDTLNGAVSIDSLEKAIGDSAIVIALDHSDVNSDVLDIWFKDALSTGDETLLTTIVGAHDGVALAQEPDIVKLSTQYYDSRPSVRAESRPDGTSTYFTTIGDNTVIGDGNQWIWDFSNNDNDVPTVGDPNSPPTGFKRKRIDVTFADPVWPKEGTLYFHNCVKSSYVDFEIVCPNGGFYLDRNDNVVQATADTPIDQFVRKHPIQGSVPMGDELNTESATIEAVPAGYIFRLLVTVPASDVVSNGCIELEMFRARTVLLPNEPL